ncbi:DUF2514 family protein [Citrobacter freundii]|nr:DUF2514 family protein [Citrobacter freundii]
MAFYSSITNESTKLSIRHGTTMLVDMPGSLAEEARYNAERADENYRAGMTCERIYESVKILTMNRREKIIDL